MDQFTQAQLKEALQVVSSTIASCEKAQTKLMPSTSQHTLLKNRLKALYISKTLMENKEHKYSAEDLTQALRPIESILGKCKKAQVKFEEGSANHSRFKKLIEAMEISKALITRQI